MDVEAQREILCVYLFQWELSAHVAVARYILLLLKYFHKSVQILCWDSILWCSSGHTKDSFIRRRADTEIVGSALLLTSSNLSKKLHPTHHFDEIIAKYLFLKLLLGLSSLGPSRCLVLGLTHLILHLCRCNCIKLSEVISSLH